MYRKPLTKFLIIIGSVCTAFVLVCCTIAFVRIFRASRETEKAQETLEAQREKMEEMEGTLKSAQKKVERAEKKRLKEEEEKIKVEPSETPIPTYAPTATPTPRASLTPTPGPSSAVSADREQAAVQPSGREERQQAMTGAGHVVGIDPGHQGPHVDMSATEPNGPGSAEMKAKATSGTSGAYSGLGEYQLNLDVSLKLQEVLEERGYRVVMTRTDNDTAISNAERALLAAEEGAEVYVRIHANGSDDHGVQGALSMCPSQDNPYVSELYSESMRLSESLLDAYCAATGFEDRGVQYTDTMTGINWSRVPVTILEMGFMTNEHDDLAMADDEFQQTMAEGIADGIDAYFAER